MLNYIVFTAFNAFSISKMYVNKSFRWLSQLIMYFEKKKLNLQSIDKTRGNRSHAITNMKMLQNIRNVSLNTTNCKKCVNCKINHLKLLLCSRCLLKVI